MGRIRTVKPEFFQHERLYEAEAESGLPLRLAFIGLWTQCDRDGRFEWRPARLKLNVLPWDDVDFSRVLDALCTRGFVVRYAVDGQEIGAIPSWRKHQVVNNRERESELPKAPENKPLRTRAPRAGTRGRDRQGELEGKGKGKEGKGTRVADALPAWLPAESWQQWLQHRKEIRKPVTELQASKQIAKLDQYRADGHDPAAVIEHSIASGWQGLFPPETRRANGHGYETPHERIKRLNRTEGADPFAEHDERAAGGGDAAPVGPDERGVRS